MSLTPYRQTLALPGIKSLLVVATLARVPITASAVVLTLHVVNDLGKGYGAAGLIGAAYTVGASLGAPVMGRFVDRHGLRPMLIVTTVAEVTFWSVAQAVPFWVLPIALIGGFLSLPAFSVARQSIAALTPEAQRLPAFALDSITTELSFMAGPALGVIIATTAGPRVAMLAVGAGLLLAGIGLFLLNPPVRSSDEEQTAASAVRVPRSAWLKPELIAVLAVTMAATVVLSGTDVAVVANLRHSGELVWSGLVMSLWAAYSLLGGFLYGLVRRGLSPVTLLAPMAVLTLFVGVGGHHWWLLALLLIPAGALCAPTITASADAVSRLTPASARGEAMGWHNSALTVGVALGSPVSGLVMDRWSPPWGFAAVGAFGVLVTLIVIPVELRRRARAHGAAVVTVSEFTPVGVSSGKPSAASAGSAVSTGKPQRAATGAAARRSTKAPPSAGAAREPQNATGGAARKPATASTGATPGTPPKATGAASGKPTKAANGAAARKPQPATTGSAPRKPPAVTSSTAPRKPQPGTTESAPRKPPAMTNGAAARKPLKATPDAADPEPQESTTNAAPGKSAKASAPAAERAAPEVSGTEIASPPVVAPPVVAPSVEAPR